MLGWTLGAMAWLGEKCGLVRTKRNRKKRTNSTKFKLASREQKTKVQLTIPTIFCSPRSFSTQKTYRVFVCVHVCESTRVRIIQSCCWQALESEFRIKREMFRHWQEQWSKQQITAQCQSSSLVLAVHGHPVTMYKQEGSEWAFHGQATFTEGQNSGKRGESQKRSNWASRCRMNAAQAAAWSMGRRLWLCAASEMES